jgi:tetratricopeptide (TPR) repeat protein
MLPETLQALRRDSAEYREQTRSGIVYAQAWIITHQWISSERYSAAIARFSELLNDGTTYAPAFLSAFGVPLETAWKDLALYAKANRYRELRFTLAPDQISQMRGQRLIDTELAPVLAELQLLLGNEQQAEAILKQHAGAAETAEALTVFGTAALRKRDLEAARAHFENAVEQNAKLAATHYGLAMTMKESGADPQEIANSLQNCIRLSPNFAEAHYVLGQMARDSKQYGEAAGHFERAAASYPKRAVYWHSLAAALHELKQTEAARRAAYKAYFASASAEEMTKVMAILDLVDSRRVQIAAKTADVSAAATLSDRKGDTRLDGTLIRVDCIGESARFHVLAGEKRVLLHSLKPHEIALKNTTAQTREFECGPQKRLAVSVEYNARPDAGLRSAGDVVAIEFKAN